MSLFSRLEIVVEPWIDGLWGALAKIQTPNKGQDPSSASPDGTEVDGPILSGVSGQDTVSIPSDVSNPNLLDVGTDNPQLTGDATDNGPTGGQKSSKTESSEATDMHVDKLAANLTERLHVAQSSYSTSVIEVRGQLETSSTSSTSTVEVRGHLAATPAGVDVRGEATAVIDERVVALRTCSPELVGVALTLPSLPAAYICLQLKQVHTYIQWSL